MPILGNSIACGSSDARRTARPFRFYAKSSPSSLISEPCETLKVPKFSDYITLRVYAYVLNPSLLYIYNIIEPKSTCLWISQRHIALKTVAHLSYFG